MTITKYLTAIESFIHKLQHLPEPDPAYVSEAMLELCSILRLGKVEVVIYENEASEHLGLSATTCFYDSGASCKNGCISKRITALDDMITFYKIYPIEGGAEWSKAEQDRISFFIDALSIFTEKFRIAKLAHRMTYFDSELDMYNLNYFMKAAFVPCKNGTIDQFTAIRFNLKRFTGINQLIGRELGTIAMKRFVGVIDDILDKGSEFICRIGGDNFIALVKSDKAQAVSDILSGTYIVYDDTTGERVLISATSGVYEIKNKDSVLLPVDIMDRVSVAAHLAKNSSNSDTVYFDDALLARTKHINEISANFPKALEEREFLVYYQPKVAIDGRYVSGAEALCRWMHNGKLVPPVDFIPILEQSRNICKLDFYMLDAVCRDIRRWLDNGMNVVPVSVNLSRRHLSDMELLSHIIEIIDRNNVPHKYIEIELTETTTDVEFTDLKRVINGLQQTGISTSVDDFGIGYSSLNLIKEIPWNVLKLDKSLLPSDNDENPSQKNVMFKYIIAMAQEMGLECISEGVETADQLRLLSDNKCNLAQGFYFDRPLPVEEFETRLDPNYVYDR